MGSLALCPALGCFILALRLVWGKDRACLEWGRGLPFFQEVFTSGLLWLLRNSRKDLVLAPGPGSFPRSCSPSRARPGFMAAAAKYKIALLINLLLPASLMPEASAVPSTGIPRPGALQGLLGVP